MDKTRSSGSDLFKLVGGLVNQPSHALSTMSSPVAKAARRVTHELHGVVVSAGLMDKTVKVRVGGQKWNKIVHKVSRASEATPWESRT